MLPAYDRNMQPAYDRMQPAYERMQAACRLHFTIVCRLHASLVRPRLKTVAGVTAPLGQSTEIQSLFSGLEQHSQNRRPDLYRIFKFDIRIWKKSYIITPTCFSVPQWQWPTKLKKTRLG